MNYLPHTPPLKTDCNELNVPVIGTGNNLLLSSFFSNTRFGSCIIACIFLFTPFVSVFSQSNTCVPGMVMNGATSPWSEECYLDDNCDEQGNPCNANDVNLIGVFIADSVGGPVPACTIGDTIEVLLWGTFMNNTGTNRYAIRSRVEVFIGGIFNTELNTCSFDVLAPGSSDAALIGTFTYVCGEQVSIVNTWVGWSTSAAQCSDPVGANYNNVCNEYPPSKCSKDLGELVFLTPNFSYDCGEVTSTTTEVCFNNLSFGGTPPLTYLWEFGDGDSSTLENPCHTYMSTSGSFTVVLTVTDSNGIMAGVQLTLDLDSLACCNLIILCPSADGGTFECIEDVPDPDPGLITVVDSCSATTITSVDSISGTGCGLDTMFLTRYYIIADSVHTDSCIQVFKVVDDLAPVITACPADITVECDNLVPVANIALVTATDNCAGMVTVTFGGEVLSDSTCANRYTLTRTYIATDACNNSSTCTQVITVFDDTPPTFTFVPANTTVNCNDIPVFGTPTATDNCGDTVTITFADSSAAAANCAGGTITRLWTATDVCGNSATASQTLTFVDADPPVFTSVPADATIACDSVPVFGTVTVIDSCDIMVTLDSTTTTAPLANCAGGTTTRTWTATDSCGNTSTASQTFSFIDTVAPVFTFVPMDATIACTAMPSFGTPVATDNCDTSVVLNSVTTVDTISNCAGGSTTRTWTATDNCGNTSTASQTLTFMDTVPPGIICPADVTVECDESTLPPDTGTATATDNCAGTPVVTFSDITVASMVCAQEYSITRTWLATDDCDNTATCVQTIIVDDSTPPDLACPPDVTVDCEDSTAPDSTGVATATDNCDMAPVVGFSDVTVQGICPQEFTVTRTWTATDECGNSTACLQVIMVQDTTPPTVNPDCQAEFTFFTSEGSDCPAAAEVSLEVGQIVGEAETWIVGGNEIPGLNGCLFDNCGDPDSLEARVDSIVYNGDNCAVDITIYFTVLNDCDTNDVNFFINVVTILDDEAPMLTCPADLTINCEESTSPDSTGMATATDNCQLVGLTFTDSIVPGLCPQEMTIFRTWMADDSCGNMSTCLQTITVQDTTPPTFEPLCQSVFNFFTSEGADCPAEATISIMEGDIVAENESWTVGGITIPSLNGCLFDNCTNPDSLVARVDSISITGDSCVRTFTVFFTIIDQCSNESVSQFVCIVNIIDDVAPVITCPTNITVSCEADVPACPTTFAEFDALPGASASDNCDPTLTYSCTTGQLVGGGCGGTITRIHTVTDDCGNSSTCAQIITVDDNTPPMITCPTNITVSCEADVPACPTTFAEFDALPGASATDSCDLTLDYSCSTGQLVGGGCGGTITRIHTVTDDCGNSATCAQIITVDDNIPPMITCPANVTIQTGEGEFIPAIDFGVLTDFALFTAAGAFDNLGPTIVSGDIGTNVGTITGFPPGVVIGQMHAANGVTAQAAADVAVAYGQLVAITCGTVLGTTLGNGQVLTPDVYCLGAASTVNLNLVLDAQGDPNAVFIFQIDGALSTNALSNVILINGASSCNVYWQVNGAFAAGTNSIFRGNLFVAGAISLNFGAELEGRAFSTAGAISTNSNVVNSLAPCSSGEIGMATATDNCGSALITYSDDIMGGECCGDLLITRTWIATDSCGNSATCAQIITVEDNTPPMITCPTDITVSCEADVPACPTTFAEFDTLPGASATDICDTTFSYSCSTGPLIGGPCGGTITRTHTVTDDCGNSSTCIQTITVDDNIAPTITCPADLTINCEESTSPDSTGIATATDDCQLSIGITSTDSIVPGICPQEMTILRTWVAEDSCGNVSSCLQTITVQDTTPPVATFIPPDITIECDENIDSVLAEVPIFMDNCDPDVPAFGSIEVVFNELCPQGPTLIQAWSGVDDCGNSTTVGRTIVVIDTTGPVITCPADVTIECTDDTSTETNGFATATDNCDSLTVVDFSDGIVEGECPQEYTINRTWTATDACGNTNTCLQTIFVIDTTPPVMTCPANLSVECVESVPPASTISVTATDNCGIPVITHLGDFTSDSTCVNRLTVTRIYQATDECGNSSTCEQIITVFDATPPIILSCPANITVQCASQVPQANIALVSATDNCSGTPVITHVGDSISNMTCVNRFTVTRTYMASDECGNTSTCAQIITVFDDTPPTITCPANVTVQCASQVPAVNIGLVTASDNCAGMTTITHVGDVITNMTCVNRFILTRTYRATDECGNSSTCAQVITVFDNTPPTITCPANVTVECASDVPPVNVATVITADNCAGTVTVTHVSDVVTNMTCLNRFTLTRTYRATDACGNSATCTQVITVFDDTPPVITFIDPLLEGVPNGGTVEVQCFGQDPEWELPTFNAGSVSVTDNCAGTVTVAFSEVLVDEGDCEVDGYINLYRLTWIATDVCGNSNSAFVFLALIDTIPPVIHGIPADTTVNCDEIPEPPSGIFATDECLCACVILFEQSDPAPGCQDGQVITRTWIAEDDCGNVTVEVQNITLIDDEGPELIMTHPELVGIEDGAILQYTCNEGGIPDFFDDLSAESINSPVTCGTSGIISFNERTIFANNCKFWGYIESRTYVWEGIDQCGNVSTLTITAQVIDTEPPVIVGVPDTTCIDDPSLDEIEAIDNCDNASLTYWDVTIENPCGDEPAIMRTYEAYDDCGNYVRDTAILLPNDFSHPIMEFVDPVLAALEFGEILIVECDIDNGQYTPYGPGDVDFIDACMVGVNVNFTETVIESRDCSDGVVAVIQLSWTATDVCGNLSEALITAHIVDNTSPEFVSFETEITIDCGDEIPEVFATDNCGEVTITTVDVIIPGQCEFEYDVMRTHTAMDPCGNRTVRRQLIHVGDGSGPEIEGVIEEVCDDLSIPEVTAYDPCADQFVEVTMVEDTLDVPCNDGIVIERIWTAVDACGHVSEVRQIIVLDDKTPPEIQVPSHSIIRRFDGHLFNLVFLSQTRMMEQLNELNAGSVFVLDDCDQEIEAEFTLVTVYSDNCEEDGYFERRTYSWVATDVCGNSDVISFTVDIMDNIPPVLEGVPENETIICEDLPPVPVVTASDPAQPVILEYIEVIESGDGPGQFVVYRTWTATDACGNSTQATQSIVWIPDSFLDCSVLLPGSVECNSHGVVIGSDLFGGIGEVTYMWEVIGEKCFIQSGQGTPEIIIYVGWSDVQISLTVTDEFGCVSVCTATLSCIDPLDPLVITDPQFLTPEIAVDHAAPSADDVDYAFILHFKLWPNPANASVNLSFESLLDHEVQFTLTNYLGQVVLNNKITAVKGYNNRKIDVSKLPEGSYLMQLISEKETRTKMLVLFRQ